MGIELTERAWVWWGGGHWLWLSQTHLYTTRRTQVRIRVFRSPVYGCSASVPYTGASEWRMS